MEIAVQHSYHSGNRNWQDGTNFETNPMARSRSHSKLAPPNDLFSAMRPGMSFTAAAFVGGMLDATRRMDACARATWTERFEHLYGHLNGQRPVITQDLLGHFCKRNETTSVHDAVFALPSYFVLLCQSIAVAILQDDAAAYLRDASLQNDDSLRDSLKALSSGRALAHHNVVPPISSFSFDWYCDLIDPPTIDRFRALFLSLADVIKELGPKCAGTDAAYHLYASLMPKNLLHITGEFHTPLWLARQLLDDTNWSPPQTVIDPFAGSGVFLLAALDQARASGIPPLEAIKYMFAIDLNPIATIACRTNLILALQTEIKRSREPISLPVLCADSLVVSLLKADKTVLWREPQQIWVDGKSIALADCDRATLAKAVSASLKTMGFDSNHWFAADDNTKTDEQTVDRLHRQLTDSSESARRLLAHITPIALKAADVVATNPPWVGWEYMSRPYRERTKAAWTSYGLYTAKGRDAAFIKEDLSTLALIAAWDHFLKPGGTSAVVLRAATMQSNLAARGLRRLSIFPNKEPLSLQLVRCFDGIRVFREAQTDAATWLLLKGKPTIFPVQVCLWARSSREWQPAPWEPLENVRRRVATSELQASRTESEDSRSSWSIGPPQCLAIAKRIRAKGDYRARMGVFTGGANAVYYVERLDSDAQDEPGVSLYKNVPERAKRNVESVTANLEDALVYNVVRGRDLNRWCAIPGATILCPHTAITKMKAIARPEMASRYPHCMRYLQKMRKVLDERKGFSAWENAVREDSFYCIQRVGTYSFEPFKVAWRYISDDFVVACVGPDTDARPVLVNDKVMMIGLSDAVEAFYLCGLLSSDPIRWAVVSAMTGTQISASIIDNLRLPRFDRNNPVHLGISECCRRGHQLTQTGEVVNANYQHRELNDLAAQMYDFTFDEMRLFLRTLEDRYGKGWL